MNFTLKNAALSVAIAAISGGAFALQNPVPNGVVPAGYTGTDLSVAMTPAANEIAEPVQEIVNIAGSSAVDPIVESFVTSLCNVAQTPTIFSDKQAAVGSSYTAIFCLVDHNKVNAANAAAGVTAPTMAADEYVLFRKRSTGGSYFGTTPIVIGNAAPNTTIGNANSAREMSISQANCGAQLAVAGYVGRVCSNANYQEGLPAMFSPANPGLIGWMGISDLPPAMFTGVNLASGQQACSSTCDGNLNQGENLAIGMGLSVTNALYLRLQAAEGLNSDSDSDGIADVTQGAAHFNTPAKQQAYEANMPTLSRNDISMLLTGTVPDWVAVKFNGVALTDASLNNAFTSAPANSNVYICRRTAGSGSQATFNAKVNNVPCSTASLPATDNTPCISTTGVATTTGSCTGSTAWNDASIAPMQGTTIVLEGSGSGDVENCMAAESTAGNYAIGIVGSDRQPVAGFTFVKVDGYSPRTQNTATGRYPIWSNGTQQWAKPTNAGGGSPTGDILSLVSAIRAKAATGTSIAAGAPTYMFGKTGGASISDPMSVDANNLPLYSDANPIMEVTYGGNTCNTAQARDGYFTGIEFTTPPSTP